MTAPATTEPAVGAAALRFLGTGHLPPDALPTADTGLMPPLYKSYPAAPRHPLTTPGETPGDTSGERLSWLLRQTGGLTRMRWMSGIMPTGLATAATEAARERRVILAPGRPGAASGSRYPVELYVAHSAVDGTAAGLSHYDPAHHALERLRDGEGRDLLLTHLAEPPSARPEFVLLLSSVLWRNSAKYGSFGYRLQSLDCGVAVAQVVAAAESTGLTAEVHLRFQDRELARQLGLDALAESVFAVVTVRGAGGGAGQKARVASPEPETSPEPAVAPTSPVASWWRTGIPAERPTPRPLTGIPAVEDAAALHEAILDGLAVGAGAESGLSPAASAISLSPVHPAAPAVADAAVRPAVGTGAMPGPGAAAPGLPVAAPAVADAAAVQEAILGGLAVGAGAESGLSPAASAISLSPVHPAAPAVADAAVRPAVGTGAMPGPGAAAPGLPVAAPAVADAAAVQEAILGGLAVGAGAESGLSPAAPAISLSPVHPAAPAVADAAVRPAVGAGAMPGPGAATGDPAIPGPASPDLPTPAPAIPLPPVDPAPASGFTRRRTVYGYRPAPVPPEVLASLFATATAPVRSDLPPAPSGGRDSVWIAGVVRGVPGVPTGAYLYERGAHALVATRGVDAARAVLYAAKSPMLADECRTATASLVVCGDPRGGIVAYGDRWYRMLNIAAGTAVQRVALAAAAAGLDSHVHCDFDLTGIADALALPAPLTPLVLVTVGRAAPDRTDPQLPLRGTITSERDSD